ncbi:MAG: DNA polymerase III subunit beta [Clostridia bacterium]|nr:DNA polymerase III subunit beta [Clostridia bacterium]
MKVRFEKEPLIAAVTPALGAVSSKSTIQAIEGLLFEAKDGVCVITGYDTEKGIRTSLECEVIEPGSYIINAQKFYSIIKTIPSGELLLTVNDRMNVKITSGKSCFELHALPGSDFPSLPVLSGETGFDIPQHVMKRFIEMTRFAIAAKDQRPIFTGAYFKISSGEITVVSCDANRLSKCVSRCEISNAHGVGDTDVSFIVPGTTLTELSRRVADTEDMMTVSLTLKHVIFTVGDIIFFSRLIDGTYIDYERILPKSHMISVEIDRGQFGASLERANLMIEEKAGSARGYVKLSFEDDRLIITSDGVSGSVYDEIPIKKQGDDIKIGFNCRFLLDAVAATDAKTLHIGLSTPLMGISITSADEKSDEDEGDFVFFMMPVRMKE